MKGVDIVFLVVISSFHIKVVSSKLDDILIAVKTSKRFQNTTLPPIINTWFETARLQTWFFTDYNNPIHQAMTDDHIVVTKCPLDIKSNPCCQMSAAIKLFMQTNHKWLCYFEDETYVNVPRLVSELQTYNYQEDWYIGQKYAKRRTQYKGYGHAFWYAASGAGWCISRSLAKKVKSFMSNFGFVSTCMRFGQPGDMTLGFIVGGLLGLNLTIVPEFHSNYEHINQIPLESLRDQITLSYGDNHAIKVPGLPIEQDPTRFISLHCFLFPCAKRCGNHPFRRKCHCHHNKKPTLKDEDSSNDLQDLTVNLYYKERLRPTAHENYGLANNNWRQSDAIATSYRNEQPKLTEQEDIGQAKEWRPESMEVSYNERPRNIKQEDLGSNKDWRRSDPTIISYHNERLEQISQEQDNGELVAAWRQPKPSVNPYNEKIKNIDRDTVNTNKEWWWSISTTDPTLEDDYVEKPEPKEKKGKTQEYYRSNDKWQMLDKALYQIQNEELGPSTEKKTKQQKFDSTVKTNHNGKLRPQIKKSSGLTKEWVWADSTVEPNDFMFGPASERAFGATFSAVSSYYVEYDYDDNQGKKSKTKVNSYLKDNYKDKPKKKKKTKKTRLRSPETKKWERIDSTVERNHKRRCIEDNSCLTTKEWYWADSTIESKWGSASTIGNSYLEDDYEDKQKRNKKTKRSKLRVPITLRFTNNGHPNHNEGPRRGIEDNFSPITESGWTDSIINSGLQHNEQPKKIKNKKRNGTKLKSSHLTVNRNHNEGPRIDGTSGRRREWWWSKSTIKPYLENGYIDDSENIQRREYYENYISEGTTVIAQIYLLPIDN